MKNNLLFLSCMGMSLCTAPLLAEDRHKATEAESSKGLTDFWRASPSQTITVTGTVRDGAGALPDVTVRVKGKNAVAVTDAEGRYTLNAEVGDVLVYSYLGYKEQFVTVSGSNVIDVVLEEDATSLQEVTVNAGYYKVKDKERTGSIAKITAKDIETQPVTNVLATMQGRMAGVNITQTTGVPGGGFDIQIRGLSSLRSGGNAPLYIIDGVPYSSDALGNGVTTVVLPNPASPLSTLNPSEIATIEILKDADATAIYGSRGANGVVLITTKKGKQGKTRYTAGFSKAYGTVTRFMDLMNTEQYLSMRKEAYANDGISTYPANAYDVNGTWDATRYTDWQEVLTGGTSEISDAQASVSGGSGKTQFLLSGNYRKETTVFPGDFAFKRGSVRTNIDHKSADDRFGATFSAGYTLQENNLPGTDLTRESRTLAPNAPALYDAEGNLNWENSTWSNPLRVLNGTYLGTTNNLIANSVLSYKLLESLELKSSFGFTDVRHSESRTSPSTLYDPAFGMGSESSSMFLNESGTRSWIAEPQLHYSEKIGDGTLDLLAGATFQSQKGQQMVLEAIGFTSNSLIDNISSASMLFVSENSRSEYRYQAFFGRANYNWKGKYLLNLTGRCDGSSRFGPGRQFANFGAVGAAWLFGEEGFFKESVLSFGKLRGSYGTSGNDQIGDYQFLDTYSASGNNYQGIVGMAPTRLFNPDFGWETNKKLEAAVEVGLFNDRLFFTAAWYRNRSSSQLVGIPLAGTTGFTSLQANLDATVENRGYEFTLRSVNLTGSHFSWISNFNITMAKNELLSFPDLASSTYKNQFVIGAPLNIKLVYNFTGLDPETGLYQFEDVNGDGQLTAAEDRKTVKDLNPSYYGGLQNQLRYHNWELDFLLQFVKQENYNQSNIFTRPGTFSNQPTALLHHWEEPGDGGHQMYSTGSSTPAGKAYSFFQNSSGAISDASYVRLKNVSVSYTLPKKWLEDVQCKLSLQAQNLVTFTKYKGADPEFKFTGFLPPLRVISAGLQLTF